MKLATLFLADDDWKDTNLWLFRNKVAPKDQILWTLFSWICPSNNWSDRAQCPLCTPNEKLCRLCKNSWLLYSLQFYTQMLVCHLWSTCRCHLVMVRKNQCIIWKRFSLHFCPDTVYHHCQIPGKVLFELKIWKLFQMSLVWIGLNGLPKLEGRGDNPPPPCSYHLCCVPAVYHHYQMPEKIWDVKNWEEWFKLGRMVSNVFTFWYLRGKDEDFFMCFR